MGNKESFKKGPKHRSASGTSLGTLGFLYVPTTPNSCGQGVCMHTVQILQRASTCFSKTLMVLVARTASLERLWSPKLNTIPMKRFTQDLWLYNSEAIANIAVKH